MIDRKAPPGGLDPTLVLIPPSHRSGRRLFCRGLRGLLGGLKPLPLGEVLGLLRVAGVVDLVSAVAELVAPSSGLLHRGGGGRGRGGAVLFLLCRGRLQAELAVVVGALNQGYHVIVFRLRERLEDAPGASHFGKKNSGSELLVGVDLPCMFFTFETTPVGPCDGYIRRAFKNCAGNTLRL